MLPERLLDLATDAGEARPRYLTERHREGVRALLDVVEAAVGRPRAEVEDRLRDAVAPRLAPRAQAALSAVLLRHHGFAVTSHGGHHRPRAVRARVFELAASSPGIDRRVVLEQAASELGLAGAAVVEAALYADLPARRVLQPAAPLGVAELVERYNLVLAQALLFRARELEVTLRERVKQVLRFARLHRLLVRATAAAEAGGRATLQISGPLSLFGHTTKYGRAMAAWLPALTRIGGWALRAECVLGGRALVFGADERDPLGTTHRPVRRFDSRVEARLHRELMALGGPWELLREADPVQIGARIVCPDFTLVDTRRGLRVPVEVVGYWRPEYIADKLEVVAALPGDVRWLLCVDRAIASQVRVHDGVFVYHRRIDAEALLRFVEQNLSLRRRHVAGVGCPQERDRGG